MHNKLIFEEEIVQNSNMSLNLTLDKNKNDETL